MNKMQNDIVHVYIFIKVTQKVNFKHMATSRSGEKLQFLFPSLRTDRQNIKQRYMKKKKHRKLPSLLFP